jgi:hypothetical protein
MTPEDPHKIPDFLKLTQEERRKAWEDNPPRQAPILVSHAPAYRSPEDEEEIRKFREERDARDKINAVARAKAREAVKKQRAGYVPGATWDLKYSRWVHPVLEHQRKEETGEAFKLVVLNKSPRAPGSRAAARFDEMVAFLDKNPKATMAEVYAATSYTRVDFDWDLQRGSVKKNYVKE